MLYCTKRKAGGKSADFKKTQGGNRVQDSARPKSVLYVFLVPVHRQISGWHNGQRLYEAKLGAEEMGKENHIFSPAYKEGEFDEILSLCGHIVLNSPSQIRKYKERIRQAGKSPGIRVNPQCSTQKEHAIYDPCAPGPGLGQ